MYVIYLLCGILLGHSSATQTCHDGELPCLTSNGTCIPEGQWCDGLIDCIDGSDEIYCNVSKCVQDHFTCKNGKCIPFAGVCNGHDNCGDGSDEECESSRGITNHSRSQQAIVEAAHYLLIQRKSDYGWDDFTPRALIALSFGEKFLPMNEKASMMKKLNLQLLLLLRNGVGNLATLALHINALYAMCEDPRDFHGIDLIELLRSKTDRAMMKSDFNIPIVILTLCIANETNYRDLNELVKIYDKRSDRIGVAALTMISMAFCNRKAEALHPGFPKMRGDFIHRSNIHERNIDVYSKALVFQAYNALGYDTSPFHSELLELQSESGSFGDLLGTYSVIPALLNSSLASLQCKTRDYLEAKLARRSSGTSEQIWFKPERHVDYSLYILDGENAGNYSLQLTFEGDKSFYDLMRMAELRNPLYRFKYDEVQGSGKKIYYLAGIPNDAEKGLIWMLYKKDDLSIKENLTRVARKETNGVDRIYPQDGDHFIFQLEHSKGY